MILDAPDERFACIMRPETVDTLREHAEIICYALASEDLDDAGHGGSGFPEAMTAALDGFRGLR